MESEVNGQFSTGLHGIVPHLLYCYCVCLFACTRVCETETKKKTKLVGGNKWMREDVGIQVGLDKGLDSSVTHHVQILLLFQCDIYNKHTLPNTHLVTLPPQCSQWFGIIMRIDSWFLTFEIKNIEDNEKWTPDKWRLLALNYTCHWWVTLSILPTFTVTTLAARTI